MEIFLTCIRAVIPIFLFMAVGYFCQRIGIIKRESVPAMNTIAFNVFLTCTVFNSVYKSDLSQSLSIGLMAFAAIATIVSFLAASLFSHFTIKVDDQKGVVTQGIFRPNFIMIGMQLVMGLGGDVAVALLAMVCIFVIPLNNIFAVITLSAHGKDNTDWKHTLINIAKNPLIIATLLAAFFVVAGINLPSGLETAINQMGNAATPLMLFLLGAFFQFKTLGKYKVQLLMVCLGRLIVVPAIVLGIAIVMGFTGAPLIVLTGIYAASTANASFTMAEQMGGDAELAGDIVIMTSALCPFTLFAWSFALMSAGLI